MHKNTNCNNSLQNYKFLGSDDNKNKIQKKLYVLLTKPDLFEDPSHISGGSAVENAVISTLQMNNFRKILKTFNTVLSSTYLTTGKKKIPWTM
jgi:hypothetical protein